MGLREILTGWAALCFIAHQANATLGEPVVSIESDQVTVPAAHQKQGATRAAYTLHELESGATTIREYVSPSGIVFGLAWNGLTHPKLDTLLGSYFADYQVAAAHTARQRGQRRQLVQGSRVIVQKWGHMRDLHGRAYDPSLLPAGVSADEIQ